MAQLYLSTGRIVPNLQMPKKQLRGFQKIELNAGETKHFSFELTPEELYIYNETTKAYQVPEGEFIVQVGGSSDILPLKGSFNLIKAEDKPDLSVTNIRTMPAFPKEGETVIFLASLINNGTGATKKGDAHFIHFYVNGKEVAHYYSKTMSIPIGGMEMICAQGLNDKNWIATKGTFDITAKIEVVKNKDLNSKNNTCEAQLTIPYGKVIPKALTKMIK